MFILPFIVFEIYFNIIIQGKVKQAMSSLFLRLPPMDL